MTRQDYELIAQVFERQYEAASSLGEGDAMEAIEDAAFDMATAFEASNPRFDRKRFLAACGVTR